VYSHFGIGVWEQDGNSIIKINLKFDLTSHTRREPPWKQAEKTICIIIANAL
jgi:hypothetical protein